jgi:amino acid transporter
MVATERPPTSPLLTEAALVERRKLKKHFGRFDIFFFLICTIVGVDTIGTVAASGGEAFTWMVVFAVVFFVPQALLFSELGTAFPQEGGPYLWTRMAFGHLIGAINNFLYWVTNPVWLGGTLSISAITAIQVFFNHGDNFSTPVFFLIGVVFIWTGVLAAVLSFGVGKWLPTAGAFARFLLLGFFSVTVVIYALKHGTHGLGGGSFKTSQTGFVALIGVLLFNYVGFELPSSAGDEMTDSRRDVPFAIARSAGLCFVLYALPILGILVVLPVSQVTNFSGLVSAIQQTFTVYGGHLTKAGPVLTGSGVILGDFGAILFVLAVLTSGITWIMGSDRALAVSGYDGAAPRSLGVISERFGTPVRVNICSGVVSTLTLVLAHQLTDGNAAKFFSAVLSVTISSTLVSYLLIFPALVKLRRSHPDVRRPFRMPLAWPLTVVLMALLVVACVQLVAPGLGSAWFNSDFAPSGWKSSERVTYLLTELIPLLVFIGIGVVFWAMGKKTRDKVIDLTVVADADTAVPSEP